LTIISKMTTTMNSYHISVLYGSVRTNRKGIRAAHYITNKLKHRKHEVTLIDPLLTPLPFLDKMYKEYGEGEAPQHMTLIANQLRQSDGFIIVTGEYNHGIPPALKNLLDHFQKEYFFKPSGIVSYSAGRFGGVREAIQLRITLAELGTPSIPSICAIPKISQALDEQGSPREDYLDKTANKFLSEFEWYLEALAEQRKKGLPY
jgi:NAD(P)H-dependent FMN reductase